MILPELTELPVVKDNNETFTGYNHSLRTSTGEWYDQKNMTTDYYPVASPRDKRSLQMSIKNGTIPVGIDRITITNDTHKIYSNYIKSNGCLGVAYTDKKLITLQKFIENDKQIGCWFTNDGEIAAINQIYPMYQLLDVEISVGGEISVFSEPTTSVTITNAKVNDISLDVGDEVELFIWDSDSSAAMNTKGLSVQKIEEDNIVFVGKGVIGVSIGRNCVITDITKLNNMLNKMKYFDVENDKKFLLRMGSYICVFPDGVVYETANTNEAIPVFKIAESVECSNVNFDTVIENDESDCGYSRFLLGSKYRFEDNQIQYYIEDDGLWVNQPTYVMIYKRNTTGTFENISEGDTVTFDYSGLDDYDPYAMVVNNKGVLENGKTTGVKVLKKGMLETDSELLINAPTDYIIVSGYIYTTSKNIKSFDVYSHDIRTIAFNLKIARKMPDIAFACESQNRIWACSKDGHEIYASALGNPYNFYDYSGISTDSYAVNVGTDGEFTACCNYLGQPLFFKEDALHYISGSYPTNGGNIDGLSYAVTTTTNFKGVEKGSERSLAIIDNILYYKSSSGIVAFDGTTTAIISNQLGKEKYKNAVAGAYKNKYYVSMQDKQGLYHLFVYDTKLGTWCKEDNTQITQFINASDELLFVTADGEVISVSDENILDREYQSEGNVDWFCETGNFGYSYPNNKYISRFQVRMQMTQGARATLYIQYNSDGVWHRKADMTGKGTKTFLIPVVPVRCDHMKLKVAGTGDVKIYSISKLLEEGSEI